MGEYSMVIVKYKDIYILFFNSALLTFKESNDHIQKLQCHN
jgi:hypothetical protein